MKKYIFLSAVFLTGCQDKLPKITVSEFMNDRPLLATYIQKCADDIGGIGQHPTCINAQEAKLKSELEDGLKRLKR